MAIIATVPQARRQGTFTTTSGRLSATLGGEILIKPTINANDFRMVTASITVRFYWLDPATQTWRTLGGGTWQGGGDPNDPDHQPEFSVTIGDHIKGQEIRAEIEIPVSIRAGCTVETLER
jgi:hypothetical protein